MNSLLQPTRISATKPESISKLSISKRARCALRQFNVTVVITSSSISKALLSVRRRLEGPCPIGSLSMYMYMHWHPCSIPPFSRVNPCETLFDVLQHGGRELLEVARRHLSTPLICGVTGGLCYINCVFY